MWILEPLKNQSGSWKNRGNLFLKKGTSPEKFPIRNYRTENLGIPLEFACQEFLKNWNWSNVERPFFPSLLDLVASTLGCVRVWGGRDPDVTITTKSKLD